jgi:chromosome segregation ATPase
VTSKEVEQRMSSIQQEIQILKRKIQSETDSINYHETQIQESNLVIETYKSRIALNEQIINDESEVK